MNTRLLAYLALAVSLALATPAMAQQTIKIGELNSYKAVPAFLDPYKKGMELALDEINAKGGVLGKKLEADLARRRRQSGRGGARRRGTGDARRRRHARRHVPVAISVWRSPISPARRRCSSSPPSRSPTRSPGQNGNKYTFRLRASTYMQVAMLMPATIAAQKKRWALVYPNFEYGQSAAANFKTLLKKAQPDVEFVTEQAPPLGKIDAGAVAQAIDDAKPDAIFNVLFGGDLAKFVREGNTRGVFKNRTVVSLLSGEPEYLDPLKDEAPVGWIVTGYPWDKIKTPEHLAFVNAYQTKYNDYPRLGSVVGYVTIKSLAAGIAKAKSTDTEKLVAAFKGLKVD